MENVLQWVVENLETVLVIAYALLNVVNGVLKLATGESKGWVATIRGLLDRVSLLTAKDGDGTVKLPLSTSKQS